MLSSSTSHPTAARVAHMGARPVQPRPRPPKTKVQSVCSCLNDTVTVSRRFAESIDYLNKALQLSPRNAHVLGAIGLSYHCTQDRERAIEYYHKALSCNAGDSFSGEMLQVALEEELGDGLAPAVDHDMSQPPSFDASSPFVLDSSVVAPALDTSDISRMSFG